MPKAQNPRHGTMQVWPRKRAKRATARVRSWGDAAKAPTGPLAFVGYKAGMTTVMATDAHKTSITKGDEIAIPTTIIECPPLKIYSVRAYAPTENGGVRVTNEVVLGKDKHLYRRLFTKKAHDPKKLESLTDDTTQYLTILVLTQPGMTGIGKKKPEIIEIALGGKLDEQLAYVKEHLASGISLADLFKEGDYIDVHAITTGKGYQGVIKRFGVALRPHKSEKGVRRVGGHGAWVAQQHWQYRIAYPGQMGYHQRVQYNNQIIKIIKADEAKETVNPKGGLLHYGLVKNDCMLVKGSVPGPKKRTLTLVKAIRLKKTRTPPTIEVINTTSQQRR